MHNKYFKLIIVGYGLWVRVGNSDAYIPDSDFPYKDTIYNGWVGAKVIGSGIITSFLSAFYKLRD